MKLSFAEKVTFYLYIWKFEHYLDGENLIKSYLNFSPLFLCYPRKEKYKDTNVFHSYNIFKRDSPNKLPHTDRSACL